MKKTLKIILVKFSKKQKITYLIGDFDLNLIDYDTNLKVNSYCDTAFSHNFIPIINKPSSVTNHNETIIDHNLTNYFDTKVDSGILKVDISDHFPIFLNSKSINIKTRHDLVFVTKRHINPFTLSLVKEKLLKVDLGFLNALKGPTESYKIFLNVCSNFYEIVFQI